MKDLGTAFVFPFKDTDWAKKFLLGAVFMVLGVFVVGIFAVAGYLVEVTQRVMRGDPRPMPEWKDVGVKFIVGFKYSVVYMIYMLPILFLLLPLMGMSIAAEFAPQGEILALIASIYAFGFIILVIPYSLALNMLLPIITYRFALNERIGDALDIGAVLSTFAKHWQNTVVVALICIGIQSVAAVGLFLFIVGILATIFYSYLVSAYLAGALYREQHADVVPQQSSAPAR